MPPRDNKNEGETASLSMTVPKKVPLVELSLQNVTYAPLVHGGKEKKRVNVLNNISTTVSPYQLTAWMGPSGSGKTSLISVAADLTRSGDLLEGSLITVNGEEGRIPKRLVGVVWQDDLLLSNLTVEENLYFAARLKTCEDIPNSTVQQTVQETMQELGLLHVQHRLVGNALTGPRGISGGERKRVSVGAELVVRPSVLFCDEPTSGLDATSAQQLMQTLKDLCRNGHSIVVVIHQPRTAIYNMLDHLLLLSRGNMLYDGHPSKARGYLELYCGELPPETGLADWIMDTIAEDERQKDDSVLAKHWSEADPSNFMIEDAPISATMESIAANSKSPADRRLSSLNELRSVPKYFTSFRTQLKLLTQRTLKQQRGERLTMTATILQFAYLFFTALFWWQLPDSTAFIFERNSLLFFILIAQANGIVIAAVTVFQRERTLLARERAKKMYTVSSYFISKTVSDMSTNVLLPLLYAVLVYWTAGFRISAAAFFKFVLTFYWIFSTAQSMGLYLSILIPNPQIALVLAPPMTLFCMIIGGFYINLNNLPAAVQWISYLSFARYGYSALIINEYEGRFIPCANNVSVTVGTTGECPLPGEEVIANLGITGVTESFWFNLCMVIALQVVFRVAAYIHLRRSR